MCDFAQIVVFSSLLACCSANTAQSLTLIAQRVCPTNATILFYGLYHHENIHHPVCLFTYTAVNSNETKLWPNFQPENRTLELTELTPHMAYQANLMCHPQQNSSITFTSDTLHFDTGGQCEVRPSPTPIVCFGSGSGVRREKVSVSLRPVDVAIGLVFGAIGLIVLVTVSCYLTKKIRQRLRIRRFLQYRQQENDPFPGLENRDDDDDLHI